MQGLIVQKISVFYIPTEQLVTWKMETVKTAYKTAQGEKADKTLPVFSKICEKLWKANARFILKIKLLQISADSVIIYQSQQRISDHLWVGGDLHLGVS